MIGNAVVASVDAETEGYVVAKFGNQLFGIPTLEIQDVVKLSHITRVPNAPHYVSGISNMRGRVVTVIDTASFLGLETQAPDHCVTSILNGDMCGFLVDQVDRVIDVPANGFSPLPFTTRKELRNVAKGVLKEEKNLVILLDMKKLLNSLKGDEDETELF